MLPLQLMFLPALLVISLPCLQLFALTLLGQPLQFRYLILIPPELLLEGLQHDHRLPPGLGRFVELLHAVRQIAHVLTVRFHFLPPLGHLSLAPFMSHPLALHPLGLLSHQIGIELQQFLNVALVTLGSVLQRLQPAVLLLSALEERQVLLLQTGDALVVVGTLLRQV